MFGRNCEVAGLMMWPFNSKPCDHPFSALGVERQQTVEQEDDDFEIVTYHLCCRRCGATSLELKHARLVGGVDGFFERARRETSNTPNAVTKGKQ